MFGRPIRDFIPVRPGDFSPSEVWIDDREKRELAMRKRFVRGYERWSERTRDLQPLTPGSRVMIQNQHGAGKTAKKWDRTGLVLENLGFNKYRVKVDGSGRVTDRNRQFLRKFTPVTPSMPGPSPSQTIGNQQVDPPSPARNSISQHFDPAPTIQVNPDLLNSPTTQDGTSSPLTPKKVATPDSPASPSSPSFITPPSSPFASDNPSEPVEVQPAVPETSTLPETPTLPRRSTRVSRPPDRWGYNKF